MKRFRMRLGSVARFVWIWLIAVSVVVSVGLLACETAEPTPIEPTRLPSATAAPAVRVEPTATQLPTRNAGADIVADGYSTVVPTRTLVPTDTPDPMPTPTASSTIAPVPTITPTSTVTPSPTATTEPTYADRKSHRCARTDIDFTPTQLPTDTPTPTAPVS